MRVIVYCCLIFLLTGCMHVHSNSDCTITMDQILDKNWDRVFIVDSFADEKIVILKDKGGDTVNAGYYTFYESGKLKSYQFVINQDTSDYSEQYDTLGNIVNIEGKPLTQSIIKRINDNRSFESDSFTVVMYFFALNKEYQALHIKTSDKDVYDVELRDDTAYYTNTKCASIGVDCKGHDIVMMHWDIESKNTCTGKTEIIKDSIPILNLHFND